MASSKSDEYLGPINEQHRLMINPQPNKLVLLLKYPTRNPEELYCDEIGNKPLELRVKPKCGLVEVDVPLDIHHHFDQEKGLEFGTALRKKAFKGDSNSFYGISSGLDSGMSKKEEDSMLEGPSHEKLLENLDDANSKGYVMNKITLGGRIEPFKDGDPIYMLATFEEDICTWTPLNGMVMLRPQFEHLDAVRLQQKSGPRFNRTDDDEKRESKAEDVNMTVKDTEDEDPQDDLYGGMAETLKILRAMADEPWQRLQWIDSEDDRACRMWEETLVYQNSENAPQLISDITQEQYLDAISCPRIDPINKGRNIMRPLDADPDDFGLTTDEEKAPPMSRPKSAKTKYLIEGTCREICEKPEDDYEKFTTLVKYFLKKDTDYAFLRKSHSLHRFFLWRFRQNKAKRGWNLKVLRQKQEAEAEKLGHMAPEGPEELPSELTDRNKGNDTKMISAEETPTASSEHSKTKRKIYRRAQNKRKGAGNAE